MRIGKERKRAKRTEILIYLGLSEISHWGGNGKERDVKQMCQNCMPTMNVNTLCSIDLACSSTIR